MGNRFGQVHTRTVLNRKKPTRINVESGKNRLGDSRRKTEIWFTTVSFFTSTSTMSADSTDSTEVAHRGRAELAQRTSFPGEKPSSNRMQVQKDSVRFKKVRTGSTYVQVRTEPMDHPEHPEKVRLPEKVRFRFRFFGSAGPL